MGDGRGRNPTKAIFFLPCVRFGVALQRFSSLSSSSTRACPFSTLHCRGRETQDLQHLLFFPLLFPWLLCYWTTTRGGTQRCAGRRRSKMWAPVQGKVEREKEDRRECHEKVVLGWHRDRLLDVVLLTHKLFRLAMSNTLHVQIRSRGKQHHFVASFSLTLTLRFFQETWWKLQKDWLATVTKNVCVRAQIISSQPIIDDEEKLPKYDEIAWIVEWDNIYHGWL